jgi:predicted metal-dependent hydrolase
VAFEFPDDLSAVWSTRFPEFACAADGVSLLMPYVEPQVVRAVRGAVPLLGDDDLVERVEGYLFQERRHHRQHRRFNDLLTVQVPALRRIEGWMDRTYRWLGEHRSLRFNVAFAAGFETVAFATARWTERHVGELFTGAEPVPATLFLWHLAEEVEHKTIAYEVFEAIDGSRLRYAAAMSLSALLLIWFTFLSTVVLLTSSKRIWNPITHLRLLRWSLSLAFEVLPSMAASAMPGHSPADLQDPSWMLDWLRQVDPDTGRMPLWVPGATAPGPTPTASTS